MNLYFHYTQAYIIRSTNFYGKTVWRKKQKIFEKNNISHKNFNNIYFANAI